MSPLFDAKPEQSLNVLRFGGEFNPDARTVYEVPNIYASDPITPLIDGGVLDHVTDEYHQICLRICDEVAQRQKGRS